MSDEIRHTGALATVLDERATELRRLREELALCKLGLLEQRGIEISSLREQVQSLTAERDKMREGLTVAEARLLYHIENAPQQRWHVAERKWIDAAEALEDRDCLAKVREAMRRRRYRRNR
jgi:hypothetical protein